MPKKSKINSQTRLKRLKEELKEIQSISERKVKKSQEKLKEKLD